ncbi:MAG TPA: PilZ domain-containing protein [Acidimicrobiales bacterium]|jgi:hypothetical protein
MAPGDDDGGTFRPLAGSDAIGHSSGVERRIGRRIPVSGHQVVLNVYQRSRFGNTKLVAHDAEVVDLSVSGIAVRVPNKVGLQPGDILTLSVQGLDGKVAVASSQAISGDALVCGLQFLDPQPPFLPVIISWMNT